MITRCLLLTSLALAAVAFAVPATASASVVWTHDHQPLEEEASAEVDGAVEFMTTTAGFNAEIAMGFVLKPGSTGTITSYKAANCVGTTALVGLSCHSTAKNLPWEMHANTDGSITITEVAIHTTFPPHSFTVEAVGNISLIPDNALTMSSVTLSGQNLTMNGTHATVSGVLPINPAGTYGMG